MQDGQRKGFLISGVSGHLLEDLERKEEMLASQWSGLQAGTVRLQGLLGLS